MRAPDALQAALGALLDTAQETSAAALGSDGTLYCGSGATAAGNDAKVYTATFTQSGTDAPVVSVANDLYTDAAGNNGFGAAIAFTSDISAPTLIITASDMLLAADEAVAVTFAFSEVPFGFDAGDVDPRVQRVEHDGLVAFAVGRRRICHPHRIRELGERCPAALHTGARTATVGADYE